MYIFNSETKRQIDINLYKRLLNSTYIISILFLISAKITFKKLCYKFNYIPQDILFSSAFKRYILQLQVINSVFVLPYNIICSFNNMLVFLP